MLFFCDLFHRQSHKFQASKEKSKRKSLRASQSYFILFGFKRGSLIKFPCNFFHEMFNDLQSRLKTFFLQVLLSLAFRTVKSFTSIIFHVILWTIKQILRLFLLPLQMMAESLWIPFSRSLKYFIFIQKFVFLVYRFENSFETSSKYDYMKCFDYILRQHFLATQPSGLSHFDEK